MKLIMILSISVFLYSCSSSLVKVMPDYEGTKILSQDLTVIFQSTPNIKNIDDFHDDFGDSATIITYIDFFKIHFTNGLKYYSRLYDINYSSDTSDVKYYPKEYNLNKKQQVTLKIPNIGQMHYMDSSKTKNILFLSNMEISRVLNPNPGGSWTAYLNLKVEFYFWDNGLL